MFNSGSIPALPINLPNFNSGRTPCHCTLVRFQGAVTRTENISLSFKELQWTDLLECAEFSKSFSQPAFALRVSWKLVSFSELGVDTQTEHQVGRHNAVRSDGMGLNPLCHKAGLLHRPGELLVCVKERGEYDMREGIGELRS